MIALCLALVACDYEQAQTLQPQEIDGRVNLAVQLPGEWEQLCFFTPYSSNGAAREVLGFRYNITARSNVAYDDSHLVLATVAGKEVIGLYEIPINSFDTASYLSSCVEREEALFDVPSAWVGK